MRFPNRIVRIAALSLGLFSLASAGAAATNPLNYPTALAVDAKGHLWVANTAANSILDFTSTYVYQKADTITQGIDYPTGLAFDPAGNLWVANYFGGNLGNVTEYAGGVQNISNTITAGILHPQGIAIDALSNIWINNNSQNVTIYAAATDYGSPTSLVRTIAPYEDVLCMTVSAGVFSYGSSSTIYQNAETLALASGTLSGGSYADNGVAMASDAAGDVYVADSNGVVILAFPSLRDSFFVQLPFVPTGIAVDSVRGRVYFSNGNANSISVYSTAAELLTTIE